MARLQLHPRLRSDLIMYPIGWSAGFEMPILSFMAVITNYVLSLFCTFVRTGKECKEKFPHFTQQSGYIDVQRSQQQGVSFWNHFSMGQLIGTSIFFRKKASCEATIWLALIFHILQNQSVNDMMFNRNAITLATSYSKLSNITSCDPYLGVCTNGGSPKWMVYNGKSIYKWMIWYPDFRKPPFIYVLICLIKFVG